MSHAHHPVTALHEGDGTEGAHDVPPDCCQRAVAQAARAAYPFPLQRQRNALLPEAVGADEQRLSLIHI